MAPATLVHPLLGRFVELIHQGAAAAEPAIALISAGHEAFDVAFWSVPDRYPHPADPLVGFLAPQRWDAIALLATGRLHALDGASETSRSMAGPTRVTSMIDRHGATVSVIDGADGPRTISDAPNGWVPDAMARTFGLATPSPDESTSAWVEAQWLDRIAPGIFGRCSDATSWAWLVSHHPLAGDLPHPSPADLAARTFTFALDTPWSALRRRQAPTLDALHSGGHPMGADLAMEPAQWFDDGSYARWLMRRMPPLDALLADLLTVMPADLGDALLDALVAVGPWS